MLLRKLIALFLPIILLFVGCNRDPEVAKRKYLESGNKYFSNGKFKEASLMYRNALKKDPKYGEAYYKLGLAQLKQNQIREAVSALRRAVELQPENSDAHAKLADIYLLAYSAQKESKNRTEFLSEVRQLSEALLKKDPKSFDGLRLDGYVKLAEGKMKEGIERFQEANQIRPNTPELVVILFQVLAADGRFPEAEKLVKSLIEKQPDFPAAYDLLHAGYIKQQRIPEAEAILKTKVANNPKEGSYVVQLAGFYHATQRRPEMLAAINRLTSDLAAFPDAHRLAGDFYFRIREFDKAVREYQAGMQSVSEDKATYQKRVVEALVFQGKRAEASQLVETVLKDNPNDNEALAMRAALILQSGKPEEIQKAVTDLQAVLSRMREPETFVVRFNLGRALLARGDVDQARVQFQESMKIRPDYLPPRLALAQLHLLQRDFTKAMQLADETIKLDPRNLPAKLIRTSALMGSGDTGRSRAELNEILKASPASRDARFQLALLNFSEKKFTDAEKLLQDLHKTNPEDPRGLTGLVEVSISQERFDQAISLLRTEIDKSPKRMDLKVALADTMVRAKRFKEAIAEYRQLVAANPQSSSLLTKLGETQRFSGDFQGAIASFKKAQQLNPKDSQPQLRLALLLEGTGKIAEAKPIYEQILKLDPDNPIALNNLAFMMAESGADLDRALTFAQQAKQKLPQSPDVADTLGWIYIKKNLSDNAIQIFTELVKNHPSRAAFRYHLAMALLQKGDKPQAKRELEAALRSTPSKEEEQNIRELLGKIG